MARFSYLMVALMLGTSLESAAQKHQIKDQEDFISISQQMLPENTVSKTRSKSGTPIAFHLKRSHSIPEDNIPVAKDPLFNLLFSFNPESDILLHIKKMEHDGFSGFHLDDLKFRLFRIPDGLLTALAVIKAVNKNPLERVKSAS